MLDTTFLLWAFPTLLSFFPVPGTDLKARFLGNSPCGVYKFKFPKGERTETCVGAKVFFFKALLSSGSSPTSEPGAFVWVKKSELKEYLKPDYLRQADRFILELWEFSGQTVVDMTTE